MNFHPHVCSVCARPSSGYGYAKTNKNPETGFDYAPKDGTPIAWVCDDPVCLRLAKDAYMKLQREFTRLDALATIEGGNQGGEYLESIGKFNLEALSEEEWGDFCRKIVGGYREALQGIVEKEAPF